MIAPIFKTRAPFHAIGLGVIYEMGGQAVIGEKLWPDFISRIGEIDALSGEMFGACVTLPGSDLFHYTACVAVSADATIPKGMEKISIQHTSYAVFSHTSGMARLGETMDMIYGKWLPESGLAVDTAHDLEVYPEGFDPGTAGAEFEIWVAVRARH